jgi:pilus assembly protein CpaF
LSLLERIQKSQGDPGQPAPQAPRAPQPSGNAPASSPRPAAAPSPRPAAAPSPRPAAAPAPGTLPPPAPAWSPPPAPPVRSAPPTPPAPIAPAPRPITLAQKVAAASAAEPPSSPSSSGGPVNLNELPAAERFSRIKSAVHDRIIGELGEKANELDRDAIVQRAEETLDLYLSGRRISLDKTTREQLLGALLADILGFGPLDLLLSDDAISDIMVNGPNKVYVERGGKMQRAAIKFDSDAHLMQIISRIVTGVGRRVDESSPMVDARLPDGSRVNVIIPPLAVKGAAVTIRKFRRDPLQITDLVTNGTMTPQMAEFLKACVNARMNIVVAGGGSSGKTTTLNVLSSFIPGDERIITVEDAAELQLRQIHVINLESRPSNVEGKGGVGIRELVINTLRMRPDRIVVGEVRSGEALDMLQAMNTGHDGSLTTVHANTPRDSISRLETLVLMAGMELPSRAIREQIASAINIIIQQNRMRDGSRRITYISEITGIEGDQISLQDIFVYKQSGYENGKVSGMHTATGILPQCLEVLESTGNMVPVEYFNPAQGSGFVKQKHVKVVERAA